MKRLLTLSALALVALPPAAAAADGLPLAVDTSPSGVVSPSGKDRYLAVQSGNRTAVIVQQTRSADLMSSALLRGTFTVPAVAYDGSASGLSADGRTLVLIRPRTSFPRARTSFAVLNARNLRLRRVVRLKGDFSFDALSPNGRLLYLIQYLSRRDPTQYQVRVYDLERRLLAREPIVDPREEPGEMYGFPITRAVSPDGRWAYTLYDGREHPFIHALDTSGQRAVCIDLDGLHGVRGLYDLRLDAGPDRLSVVGKRGPLANVEVGSWRVSEPPKPTAAQQTGDGDGAPWGALAAAAALLGAGALLVLRRQRRRPPEPEPAWPPLDGAGNGNGAEPARERETVDRR
jgi:LPXTG-motif cell wall-anchored protein